VLIRLSILVNFLNKNTPSLKATKIYKNQVIMFCFCSNEMQPCRIWGAKQKTESVAPRASTKLKKEQIALFLHFFELMTTFSSLV
jgi:hypothetical protein